MRHLFGTAFTFLLCCPLAATDPAQDPEKDKGWVSLFDGKSLAGWKPNVPHRTRYRYGGRPGRP